MAYNTKPLKRDVNKTVVPQYFNEETDEWEIVKGANGAYFMQVIGTTPTTPNGDIDGGTFLDSSGSPNFDGGEF